MEKPESLWQQEGKAAAAQNATPADLEKQRRHTKGIIWILSPIISLPFVLLAYAITRFVAAQSVVQPALDTGAELVQTGLGQVSTSSTMLQILSLILTLIPITLIPVGIIVGLIYLLKK